MLEHTNNFYQTSCHTPLIHMIHSTDHMIQVKVKILGHHQVAVRGIPKVLWLKTLSLYKFLPWIWGLVLEQRTSKTVVRGAWLETEENQVWPEKRENGCSGQSIFSWSIS